MFIATDTQDGHICFDLHVLVQPLCGDIHALVPAERRQIRVFGDDEKAVSIPMLL